jgi:hypothetical protein
MPTIVKAYAITEQTLLQSINEDGWLSKIGKGLGFNKDKPAPAAPTKPATPDIAKPRADIEAGDPLGHVVSAILNPVQIGQVRVVVRMSKDELSSLYLKDDDTSHAQLAAELAKTASAEPNAAKPAAKKPAQKKPAAKKPAAAKPTPAAATQPAASPATPDPNDVRGMQQSEQYSWLKAIVNEDDAPPPQAAKPAPVSNVVALNRGYKFSDLIKGAGGAEVSVLLNVPDSIYHAYKTAATPEDRTRALTQMFNHKYYAMSISNSEAAKIAPAVDKHMGDMEAEKAALNPGIIVNHPGAQTIKFAKREWHEKYSEKHSALSSSGKPASPTDEPKPDSENPADAAEKNLANSVAQTNAAKSDAAPAAAPPETPAAAPAASTAPAASAEVPKWKQMKDAKKAGWVKEITSVKDIHSQLADYADKPKMVKLLNDRLGEILAKTG